MATFAEFALPPETFSLGAVFEEFPEATVELERVVPTGEVVRPYFWIENVASQTVREFFEARSVVEEVRLIDPLGGRSLFRYRCRRDDNALLTALVESDLTLLSAAGTREGWTVYVRGDRRRWVAEFDERCREAGIPLTLQDLHEATTSSAEHPPSVTDAQREALLLAYERGYYAEPREATLDDLAAEVGISRQAFARRLRRGYRTLIQSHLRLATEYEDVT